MISTEIQAINIGTTQASALYIGTTQIWSGSTPTPPLPDNMERQEFIPADIYDEYIEAGMSLSPINVTLGNIRVRSNDQDSYIDDYMFYGTNNTSISYWLGIETTSRNWYVYSIELEFDGGTEDWVGGDINSRYSFDQLGTYTISNGKLTWNWDSSNPVRVVDFFNVADQDEYGEVSLEITKITVVAAQQTVTSLNAPTITGEAHADYSEFEITSGNSGLGTTIYYLDNWSDPFHSTWHEYTNKVTIYWSSGGNTIEAKETYTEYPFDEIESAHTTYTIPAYVPPPTPASSGEYVFNCSDDTPIADRQQYTVTRGNVSMTVSDGLIYLDQHYRIYAAQTITFSAGGSTMSHIEFDFISGYANNSSTVLSADSGTCANNYATDLTGEWNGSATSVTITTSKQIRVPEFRVTVD